MNENFKCKYHFKINFVTLFHLEAIYFEEELEGNFFDFGLDCAQTRHH